MPMTPFVMRFRELGEAETRVLYARGMPDLPDGDYAFSESYCDEPGCDCRRVIINVISSPANPGHWATINYGWESVDFYTRWLRGDKTLAAQCKGPELDPLNRQTKYAPVFLEIFESVLKDPLYVERLKRHYQLFKSTVGPVAKPKGLKRTPPKVRKRQRR
ncbi:MAG: hypothetical protein ACKV2V_15665 [Blastocatellia bacterium]